MFFKVYSIKESEIPKNKTTQPFKKGRLMTLLAQSMLEGMPSGTFIIHTPSVVASKLGGVRHFCYGVLVDDTVVNVGRLSPPVKRLFTDPLNRNSFNMYLPLDLTFFNGDKGSRKEYGLARKDQLYEIPSLH